MRGEERREGRRAKGVPPLPLPLFPPPKDPRGGSISHLTRCRTSEQRRIISDVFFAHTIIFLKGKREGEGGGLVRLELGVEREIEGNKKKKKLIMVIMMTIIITIIIIIIMMVMMRLKS